MHSEVGGKLTLTDLGHPLYSQAYCKHNIKGVDRLLGNAHRHTERLRLYQCIAHGLIGSTPRLVIIVDWSDRRSGHEYRMLKAACRWVAEPCPSMKRCIR